MAGLNSPFGKAAGAKSKARFATPPGSPTSFLGKVRKFIMGPSEKIGSGTADQLINMHKKKK